MNYVVMCLQNKDPTTELIRFQVPYIFPPNQLVPIWQAICTKLLSITAILIWVYVDAFIIVFGFSLATHFRLFNAELALIKNEVSSKMNLSNRFG